MSPRSTCSLRRDRADTPALPNRRVGVRCWPRALEVHMGNSVLQTGSFKFFDEGGRPFVVD